MSIKIPRLGGGGYFGGGGGEVPILFLWARRFLEKKPFRGLRVKFEFSTDFCKRQFLCQRVGAHAMGRTATRASKEDSEFSDS